MRLLIRLQRGREWVNEVDKSIIGIWCYGELCCVCIFILLQYYLGNLSSLI